MQFPEWVVPMAATLTQERFSGPEWIFERKYDGIRLIAFRKDNTIRLAGKKSVSFPENVSVHRRERISGEFDRTLSLPVQLDPDRIKAEYRDGILALFLPRTERDKPRMIKIG